MANKIKLGARPKAFKPFPVKFELPDGGEGVIQTTYKYRTKSEFGQLLDTMLGRKKGEIAEGAAGTAEPGVEFSWEKLFAENAEAGADYLLDCIEAWDLGEPLSREVLLQLGDECPAAVAALMASYAGACRDGRLGN